MAANDGVRRGEAARSSNSPFTRRHANSIGRPTRPRSIFAQDWNLASSTSAPANAMSRVAKRSPCALGLHFKPAHRQNTLGSHCAITSRRGETMSNDVNRQWLLVRRPEGNIRPEDFRLTEAPIPTPEQGQV